MSAMRPGRRRFMAFVLLLAGLAIAVAVVLSVDRSAVAEAFARGGWALLPIALFRFAPLAADTAAWQLVMARPPAASFLRLLAFRWIGESVNNLLPVAQVGGAVVRARLLAATGFGGAAAGASVMADFVLGLVAQAVFTVVGLAALAGMAGWSRDVADIALAVTVGIVLVAIFILLQRGSMLGRMAAWMNRRAPGGGFAVGSGLAAMDSDLRQTYARRGAVVGGTAWRLAGWCLHAGEVWLILHLMGFPISLAEAVVLESMSSAARSAAFAVPAGVGVQEAGIVAVAVLVGLPAEAGLALALVRRGREVVTSVPGLVAWAVAERRGLAGAPAAGPRP